MTSLRPTLMLGLLLTIAGCASHRGPQPAALPELSDGARVRIDERTVVIESSRLQRLRGATLVGPRRGTILLHGGGALTGGLLDVLAEKSGGRDGRLVVIPTANCRQDTFDVVSGPAAFLNEAGFSDVVVLHTREPSEADSREFVRPLDDARAVWLAGGGAECLVAPYLGSRTWAALARVLDRGGVVVGKSAGAVALGTYFEIRFADPPGRIRFEGFDLLRSVAVGAHCDRYAQPRETLAELVRIYPSLLGICLDEGSFAIVEGDSLTVGEGAPATTLFGANMRRPVILHGGDRYDLAERRRLD